MADRRDPLRRNTESDEPIDLVPDVLSKRPSKAKRNRRWEKENKPTCYRNINPQTHEAAVALANELRVPVGELVNYLIEYGLEQHRSGNLSLDTRPVIGNNTLY